MAPKSRRKAKKNTLHYALEVCDYRQFTAIISSKTDLDSQSGMEVMNIIRNQREVNRESISPLQGAVTLGHVNICKHLIQEGAAVFKSVSSIPHPLCLALLKGHYEIADLLLEAGADVNLAFDNKLPIGFALYNENCPVQIVKKIISKGFPVNGIAYRVSGKTVLHSSVGMNHLSIVKYLFTLNNINPDIKDKKGLAPMHYAVQKDLRDMVKLLVKNGANVDCECHEHFTPLFYAIATGNYEMVKLLISLGADIYHVNGNKKCTMMPLNFAANFCQLKITQLLLEKGAEVNKIVPMTGEIALHSAARADTQNNQQSKISLDCIVELLIKKGSNLDARHKYGLTPLQVALKAKNVSVAKILVVNGSKVNDGVHDTEADCYTTFHVAAKCLDAELIKVFLDYGADCMAKDDENVYPCHLAVLTSMIEEATHSVDCKQTLISPLCDYDLSAIFKLFWKHGFPYDMVLKNKWLTHNKIPIPTKISSLIQKQKMLFVGVLSQQAKLVQKAIIHGAYVHCCSTEVPFPLHFIATRGNEVILKQFLINGALVNVLDNHGETPLHQAAKEGHVNCCRLLLEYGAVFNYSSSICPKTPVEYAKENENTEVVTLLTTVGKHFRELKKGNFKKLKTNMNLFNVVMNCRHRDGLTMLETAVNLRMTESAARLMKLRMQISS